MKLSWLWTKHNFVPFQNRYLMVIFPSLYSDTMIPDSITKDVCFDNVCLFFCLGVTNRYFSEDILVKYQTKIQWRYFSFLSVVFKPVCRTIGRRLGHFLISNLKFSNQTFPQLKLVFGVTFQPLFTPRQNAGLKRPTKFFARLSSSGAGCLVCLLGYLVIGCVEVVMSNQMIWGDVCA